MTLEPKPGGFIVRLRYGRDAAGKPQRDRFLIATSDETVAADIEIRMTAAAHSLAGLQHPKAKELLIEMGRVAGDPKAFRALEGVVSKLVSEAGSSLPVGPASGPSTFRDVVELWTSGKLRERYPERVRTKTATGHRNDLASLSVFFPVLGDKTIAEIDDDLISRAKRLMPASLDPDSRRLYLVRLRTVFRYARRPLKLIETVPDELEELPPLKKRNLFWFLYPEEEARLCACTKIPLAYRVLYAWLVRNGSRISETLLLDYLHLDLDRGRVRLEAEWTKTGRARFWDLEPDVHAAMRLWRQLDGDPKGESRVFHAPRGLQLHKTTVQKRFLYDLLQAGIDRPELHETTKGSRRLRVHDTRSSFCTMARRRGMPDTWIMDRSGHESVTQLEKYARFVRHADEQQLAQWFAPMDQAIPELRFADRGVGQAWAIAHATSRKQALPREARLSDSEQRNEPNQTKTPSKPASVTPETPLPPTSGPASFQGVGQNPQSGPPSGEVTPDPTESVVERALAVALEAAIGAQRWDLALEVTRELGERRRTRTAPSVPSLADARRKKDEGK